MKNTKRSQVYLTLAVLLLTSCAHQNLTESKLHEFITGSELSAQCPQISVDKLNLLIKVVKNHSLVGRI